MKELNWSYGGGTQSVAIAVLIAQGRLPKPDRIVMADTGRERQKTWEYLRAHVEPLLAPLGLRVEIAPHSLATVDLYSGNGDLLLPAFTQNGKLPAFCSSEWKARVVRRYLREQGVDECITWLGMSVDEVVRIKPSPEEWQTHHWPLCYDVRMRREDCRELVIDYGLPDPPRSCCWMCSNMTDAQWLDMKENEPADFRKACGLDASVRARDGQGGVYLHKSRKPLAVVTFQREQQDELWGCESGYCFN